MAISKAYLRERAWNISNWIYTGYFYNLENPYLFIHALVYQFPRTVITDYHKLVGLNQEKFILSNFWRPEIWRPSALRAVFVLMSQGRIPLASSRFLLGAGILGIAGLEAASLQVLPVFSHGLLSSVCVCVLCF